MKRIAFKFHNTFVCSGRSCSDEKEEAENEDHSAAVILDICNASEIEFIERLRKK
jgi:hypothetical protein